MYKITEVDGRWLWRLYANNHRCMLRCPPNGYNTYTEAKDNVGRIYQWANQVAKPMTSFVYHEGSSHHSYRHYFSVLGLTGCAVLGHSNYYKSPRTMHRGVEAVVRAARSWQIEHA